MASVEQVGRENLRGEPALARRGSETGEPPSFDPTREEALLPRVFGMGRRRK